MQSALRNAFVGLALVALPITTTSASAQSEGASGMGSWKLNVEKSKFSPGPAPKGITTKFEPAGYTTTVKGTTAKGEPIDHRMVFDKQ